jgi:hypothetical protein
MGESTLALFNGLNFCVFCSFVTLRLAVGVLSLMNDEALSRLLPLLSSPFPSPKTFLNYFLLGLSLAR